MFMLSIGTSSSERLPMCGGLRAGCDGSIALLLLFLLRVDLSGGNDTSYLLWVFCIISIPRRAWIAGVEQGIAEREADDVILTREAIR